MKQLRKFLLMNSSSKSYEKYLRWSLFLVKIFKVYLELYLAQLGFQNLPLHLFLKTLCKAAPVLCKDNALLLLLLSGTTGLLSLITTTWTLEIGILTLCNINLHLA